MSPKLRAVLFPVLAALCGYLASYFSAGCSPAQIQKAESAVDREVAKAACVKEVAERFDDLLVDPIMLKPSDVLAFKAELEACLKPAPVGDAGA